MRLHSEKERRLVKGTSGSSPITLALERDKLAYVLHFSILRMRVAYVQEPLCRHPQAVRREPSLPQRFLQPSHLRLVSKESCVDLPLRLEGHFRARRPRRVCTRVVKIYVGAKGGSNPTTPVENRRADGRLASKRRRRFEDISTHATCTAMDLAWQRRTVSYNCARRALRERAGWHDKDRDQETRTSFPKSL